MITALVAASLGASAQASVPPPLRRSSVSENPMRPQPVEDITARMRAALAADPLTPEQEARLPLARQLAEAMLPPGFYTDTLQAEMMPLLRIGGLSLAGNGARLIVKNATGQPWDKVSRLSDDAIIEATALLDPAAQRRADAVSASMKELAAQVAADVEPALREGYARAFAARFSDTDINAIKRFATTSSGATFFRQFLAIHTDTRVQIARLAIAPTIMAMLEPIAARFQTATKTLPERRNFSDLRQAERERLARLLDIGVAELQQSMALVQHVPSEPKIPPPLPR